MSAPLHRMWTSESILYALRQHSRELVLQGLARRGKSGILMTNEIGHLTQRLLCIVDAEPRSDVACSENPDDATADLERIS